MGFSVGDIGDSGFVIGSGFSFFFTPKNVFTGWYLNIAVSEILFFMAAVLTWPLVKSYFR